MWNKPSGARCNIDMAAGDLNASGRGHTQEHLIAVLQRLTKVDCAEAVKAKGPSDETDVPLAK